jgi:hypothetical protein
MEGNELRYSILAAMMILMASSAMAFGGPGSVVVDIVGSNVEDTKVVAGWPWRYRPGNHRKHRRKTL